MDDLILTHIIPSGSDKTICGLKESKTVIGTSLGMTCDCRDCYEIANKLHKSQLKSKKGGIRC